MPVGRPRGIGSPPAGGRSARSTAHRIGTRARRPPGATSASPATIGLRCASHPSHTYDRGCSWSPPDWRSWAAEAPIAPPRVLGHHPRLDLTPRHHPRKQPRCRPRPPARRGPPAQPLVPRAARDVPVGVGSRVPALPTPRAQAQPERARTAQSQRQAKTTRSPVSRAPDPVSPTPNASHSQTRPTTSPTRPEALRSAVQLVALPGNVAVPADINRRFGRQRNAALDHRPTRLRGSHRRTAGLADGEDRRRSRARPRAHPFLTSERALVCTASRGFQTLPTLLLVVEGRRLA